MTIGNVVSDDRNLFATKRHLRRHPLVLWIFMRQRRITRFIGGITKRLIGTLMLVMNKIIGNSNSSFLVPATIVLRNGRASKMDTRRNRQLGHLDTRRRRVRQILIITVNTKSGSMINKMIDENVRGTIRRRRANLLIRLVFLFATLEGLRSTSGVVKLSSTKKGVIPCVTR